MEDREHQRLTAIFAGACERIGDARAAYLDAACGGDAPFRQRIEVLLAADQDGRDFLSSPPITAECVRQVIDDAGPDAGPLPAQIGGYQILRVIGQGGMGVVYEASQASPPRLVALKVLRPGYHTPRLRRRFEHEVQLLGRLRHPGIAQIYDAGVAQVVVPGHPPVLQPYFAMELVDGRPLLEYARTAVLDVRDRIALLATICDAVHHGHLRGVIHRDLKPANILVEPAGAAGAPQAKIIDFGVARATDGDADPTTLRTSVGQMIGTLPYMSPEQVAGDAAAIDLRSDIYSLGVIGFELLTGRLPYDADSTSLVAAARIITERPPLRLGEADRSLRGDLETIISVALEKSPSRRYASAAAMSDDLRRFLASEPIGARPPTAIYQIRTLVRRHRALAAGILLAAAGLVLGSAAATWQALRATAERNRAEAEAALAQRVSECLNGVFNSIGAESQITGGPLETRPLPQVILALSVERVSEELRDRPAQQAVLLETIGFAYARLGLDDRAVEVLQSALQASERSGGGASPEAANTLCLLAGLAPVRTPVPDRIALLQRAVSILRNSREPIWRAQLASAEASLAVALALAERRDEAEVSASEALRIWDSLSDPPTASRAMCLLEVSAIREHGGDRAGAEAAADQALALEQSREPHDPHRAVTLVWRASQQRRFGDLAGARQSLESGMEVWRSIDDHATLAAGLAAASIGVQLDVLNEHERAVEFLRTAIATLRVQMGADHPFVADKTLALGHSLQELRRYDQAEPAYREALRIFRLSPGGVHTDIGTCLFRLAQIAAARADQVGLDRLYQEALDLRALADTLPSDHPHQSGSLLLLGLLELKRGHPADAEVHLTHCIQLRSSTLGESHKLTAYARAVLGECLAAQGRFEEAEPLLLGAEPIISAAYGERSTMEEETVARLADLYRLWGKDESAGPWSTRLSGFGQPLDPDSTLVGGR